mgnify:CR=1 FL=1
MLKTFLFTTITFFILYDTSHAYLGPGIGGGILIATLGVVIAIFAAIFGLVWYPLKKILKNRKKKNDLKN